MKLHYIDTARGIAILMVILVHTSQPIGVLDICPDILTAYGQMGVQLFFMVSAFTLCLSKESREGEKHATLNFFIRRFFRIAPLFYCGIIGYFVVRVINYSCVYGQISIPEDYTSISILSHIFFVHEFILSANNTVVPGSWSIGSEMAFYAMFPFMYFVARKANAESPLNSILFALVFLFAVYAFGEILVSQFNMCVRNNNFFYYLIVNQLPVFAIGISYYFLQKKNVLSCSSFTKLMCFLFFTALSIYTWTSVPLENKFIFVPAFSAVSFVFLIELLKNYPKLNFPAVIRIGQLSYLSTWCTFYSRIY